MIRKAKAVWHGTGRAGNGNLSTDSSVLADTPYSFKTRFENEKGTNPEELIAAAHAGCFTMALAFQLQGGGFTPNELSTEAAVTIEPEAPHLGRPQKHRGIGQIRFHLAHQVVRAVGHRALEHALHQRQPLPGAELIVLGRGRCLGVGHGNRHHPSGQQRRCVSC